MFFIFAYLLLCTQKEIKAEIRCPYGATNVNGKCVCQYGREYDTRKNKCFKCHIGEGLDHETQECTRCINGKGITKNYECGICDIGEGIDNETKKCKICDIGEGILQYTNLCGKCPDNSIINEANKKCECQNGFYTAESGECEPCPYGQIADPNDNTKCTYCSDGFCLNTETKKCESIQGNDRKAINPETKVCIQCPEGSTKVSNYCKCNNQNEGFDSNFLKCGPCNEYETIDSNGKCSKCDIYHCYDISKKQCVRMNSNYFKNKDSGQCETECTENYHPLARVCGKCPEGSINGIDNLCRCKDGEGITEIDGEYKCITCPNFYGTDDNTNECINCSQNECVQDGKCVYINNYILENGTCTGRCEEPSEVVDRRKCTPCEPYQCEDGYGKCRYRSIGEYIGDFFWCKCPPFYGRNDAQSRCIPCEADQCVSYGFCISVFYDDDKKYVIDSNTGECRESCYNDKYNPITNTCGKCPPGTDKNGRCECPKYQDYITQENKCGICPIDQATDTYNKYCKKCGPDEGIHPLNNSCVKLNDFDAIHPIFRYIVHCNKSECIDPSTRYCIPIPENKAVSPLNGMCVTCPSTSVIDDEKKCLCPKGEGYNSLNGLCEKCKYGIDPLTNRCVICANRNRGIDHETRYCRKCNVDEGINALTGECGQCPNGTSVSHDSPICKCPAFHGLNYRTNQCERCSDGAGISNNRCERCNSGYGIDQDTGLCRICPVGQGIDKDTGFCRICPEKEGIDPYSKKCVTCPENYGIDIFTGICKKCTGDQFLNKTTLKCSCRSGYYAENRNENNCFRCYDGEVSEDQTDCISCDKINLVYDSKSKKCVKCPENAPYFNGKCHTQYNGKCIFNGIWMGLWQGVTLDKETNLCKCSPGYQFVVNGQSISCISCKDDEGIDPITGNCSKCDNKNGYAIDKETRECRMRQNETEAISTANLRWIQIPKDAQIYNNFTKCPEGFGFDSSGENCIECLDENKYIENYTGQCSSCSSENQTCNNDTNTCLCQDHYGLDEKNNCVKCSDNDEGIDPTNYRCRKCNYDDFEGIDENGFCIYCKEDEAFIRSTKQCIKCPKYSTFDTVSRMCMCPYFTGLNPNISQCIECKTLGMCMDPITKECIECEVGYGIDEKTGFPVFCEEGHYRNICIDKETRICRTVLPGEMQNYTTYECQCKHNYVQDPVTGECRLCAVNEGVVGISERCEVCNEDEGEAIDRISFRCTKCSNGLGINKTSHRCEYCGKGEGIDPKTRVCGPCGEGKGIDWETKECTTCLNGQFIDPETHYCLCPVKQAYNETENKCTFCPEGLGIDPITHTCRVGDTNKNECVSRINGEWVPSVVNQHPEEKTNLCTCIGAFHPELNRCDICGYNQISNQEKNVCEYCPKDHVIDPDNANACKRLNFTNHEGIDPITKKWRICRDDQGIDDLSNECIECPVFAKISGDDFRCKCDKGMGIDEDSWMCVKCTGGDIIDPITKRCRPCPVGLAPGEEEGTCVPCPKKQGINQTTGLCSKCQEGYGIDPITKICVRCPQYQGILPDSYECGRCEVELGIDPTTRLCRKCEPNESLNSDLLCFKCKDGYGFDENKRHCYQCIENCKLCPMNYSVCSTCQDSFILVDGKCIESGRPVTPTEVPVITPNAPELVDASLEKNDDNKFELKEQEQIKNKPCKVDIGKDYEGQTIVIDDKGQKQTQVTIKEGIEVVNIEQISNKQLDIKVENGKSVTVNIKNPVSTSVKGKGEITLNDQDNKQLIALESIVPSINENLKINSNSQIKANRLEFYGNSNVVFEGQKSALIDTVVLQQKSSTTLQNVEIGTSLIAGLQTSIVIGENVKIAGTQLELSDSNGNQDSAVISGKLIEKPDKISIKDRNDGEILDDGKKFVIAESNDPGFNCDEWAASFDHESNPKYNKATCTKNENSGSVKLVAENNGPTEKSKGGLKPGVIAAIVIAVVVVVAAVIVLVWFFVFRKRNKYYSGNENSLPEDNNNEEV